VADTGNWITVAERSLLDVGAIIGAKAGGLDVALYNIAGAIYATHNVCTHALAFTSDAWLEGGIIECPLHGGRFEVKTGKGLGLPITCDLKVLLVRIEGNSVQVDVA
jgi:nitrite reductase/ring-hydroxylating ferredoxin subunit